MDAKIKCLIAGRIYNLEQLDLGFKPDLSTSDFMEQVDELIERGVIHKPSKKEIKAVYQEITGNSFKLPKID